MRTLYPSAKLVQRRARANPMRRSLQLLDEPRAGAGRSKIMIGTVYLVGAGPGDPELITVKGLNLLRRADVVIYDRLAPAELLREARHDAELIDGGKRPQKHRLDQEDINALLIDRARKG